MTDQEIGQRKKLLLFFAAGTLLSLTSALVFEVRFAFHWMSDVSLVSMAIASPGHVLLVLLSGFFYGLHGEPIWLRYVLASVTNGFVYAGIVYLMPLVGVRSTKMQVVVLIGLLLTLGALSICMWEGCYHVEYWN